MLLIFLSHWDFCRQPNTVKVNTNLCWSPHWKIRFKKFNSCVPFARDNVLDTLVNRQASLTFHRSYFFSKMYFQGILSAVDTTAVPTKTETSAKWDNVLLSFGRVTRETLHILNRCFSVNVWDARSVFAATKLEDNKHCTCVLLVLIIVIKLSHCSNIRRTLSLNQKRRWHYFPDPSLLGGADPPRARPCLGLHFGSLEVIEIHVTFGRKQSDLTFPWIVSSDRALNEDIIFHKGLRRKWVRSQHRCGGQRSQKDKSSGHSERQSCGCIYFTSMTCVSWMESYLLIMLSLHYTKQSADAT